jgi:murein L,D-transpeptidase YafK
VGSGLRVAWADSAAPATADRILIEKSQRRLTLFSHDAPIKVYRIALGTHPVGAKEREGDGRTPEGHYIIDARNAGSPFHKALHVSYPNEDDRKRASAEGVKPGGGIEIHGLRKGASWIGSVQHLYDWTRGCIAVTNPEIDEIWKWVPVGTPVDIQP